MIDERGNSESFLLSSSNSIAASALIGAQSIQSETIIIFDTQKHRLSLSFHSTQININNAATSAHCLSIGGCTQQFGRMSRFAVIQVMSVQYVHDQSNTLLLYNTITVVFDNTYLDH